MNLRSRGTIGETVVLILLFLSATEEGRALEHVCWDVTFPDLGLPPHFTDSPAKRFVLVFAFYSVMELGPESRPSHV